MTGSASEAPHTTTEKRVPTTMHQSQPTENCCNNHSDEQITTDTDVNADSSAGGQHGPGVTMTAGVSVLVIVLVLLAAAVITAIVLYLVRKKHAPQSKGFTKLSMTNMQESNGVAVHV